MIDYAYLCQTIADWRAGRRPSMPPSATPTLPGSGVSSTAPIDLYPAAAPEAPMDEDIDSDLVEVEEQLDAGPDADEDVDATTDDAGDLEMTSEPPPDYDSTMVYGGGGELPGQSWESETPAVDDDGEPIVR